MIEKQMADGVIALVKRGIAAAMQSVGEQIAALGKRADEIELAIAQIPAGRDGRDGQKGEPGERGTNGRDGINGKDGLGFDDVSVEYDGERNFTIKLANGDRVKEFGFVLPLVIDKGYFKEGNDYSRGDSVTFGGSAWIAQTETKSKPEVGNPDWRLAVRKGRDGKDWDRKS